MSNNLEIINKEKSENDFRNYFEKQGRVYQFYKDNHKNQTFEYVKKIHESIFPLGRWKLDIFEVISLLDEIVDDSDPDTDKKQIIHSLQTGEACRKIFPDKDWFHLMGFIHDLGKILNHPKMHNLPQWCVVGDTYPLGCAFSDKCVYYDEFKSNPDYNNEIYSTKFGIYEKNVGFDNIVMSFGHDEYLYQVLNNNECNLPEEAMYVIRYHSFYPWHSSGAYEYLANSKDSKYLQLVKAFQTCDLYSKIEEDLDVDKLLPYYQNLIIKYFPDNILSW
jgi:inositol oxygenase